MPPKVKITKEDILKTAFEMTRNDGIETVSAQSIAKKLNCSIHPVYWVFETMENLRRAVINEAVIEYNRYYEKEIEGFPKYKMTGWNYIHFAKEQPQLFKLLFMSGKQDNKKAAESNMDGKKEYVISLITQQLGCGEKAANDLYVKMWIFAHGIATMVVTDTVNFDDETISGMLTSVYQGILKNMNI